MVVNIYALSMQFLIFLYADCSSFSIPFSIYFCNLKFRTLVYSLAMFDMRFIPLVLLGIRESFPFFGNRFYDNFIPISWYITGSETHIK